MTTGRPPNRWTAAKLKRVLTHYERQSDAEAVAEDEAAYRLRKETFMEIPVELVPSVRRLLAKHAVA